MKKLNLQLEREVFDWARAEAARLNLDFSGFVKKLLNEQLPERVRFGRNSLRSKRWPRLTG